jgi:ATP-dependent helicase HrpB
VLAAYPDRVARRREPRSDRLLLSSGTGARLARESGVHNAEFLVAVDVVAATAVGGEALVRLATGIEREWLVPTSREVVHTFDAAEGVVRARQEERYDGLVMREHPCAPEAAEATKLIADAYARRGPTAADLRWLRRLEFAGVPIVFEALVELAAHGVARLADVQIGDHVPPEARRIVDRAAPLTIRAPSGRDVTLDYRDGGVYASVKLQELFGLADTPRIGPRQVPLTFELLAPSGRPVQVTSDLRSFWARGYPEVRKELRARYPKHPWPEDPWTAVATGRTKTK